MKTCLFSIALAVTLAVSNQIARADWMSQLGLAPAATNSPSHVSPALAALSQDQMVGALKEALGDGLQQAVASLGRANGFSTNLEVKIPMPDKLRSVEKTLRALKQNQLADNFIATMNHAAEQAVPEAASVFVDAVKQMSIDDARSILAGPKDAATQFLRRATETNLYTHFYPIVQKATATNGVTGAYKNMLAKVNSNAGGWGGMLNNALGADAMDMDAYVTHKALDGLFKLVADEEARIRQNPAAQASSLLQSVFGAVGK